MYTCKISVIIATYNTADYLEECLDSIFGQTLRELEVILIDDGSTDYTDSIVKKYKQKYDNLVIIQQKNHGAGRARNYGISLSCGEYMIFMDPDDRYPCEDCLERLYISAQTYNVSICGGNILSNDNGVIKNWYLAGTGDTACTKNGVINTDNYSFLYGHTRYLFKADLIKNNQVKYAHYSNYEDQVFTIAALGIAGRFYELDYPVYEYRINYKRRELNLDVIYDTLCGFRDTLKLMIKYNMRLMYEKNYYNFIENHMAQIANYAFCGNEKFDKIICDINSLIKESGWKCEEEFIITPQQIIRYRKKTEETKEKLNQLFAKSNPILLYGAGRNTNRLISAYKDKMKNVIGIAVSDLEGNPSEYEGIPVRSIENYIMYKNRAIVLITPSVRTKKEIIAILEQNGFKKYQWIDVRMIN